MTIGISHWQPTVAAGLKPGRSRAYRRSARRIPAPWRGRAARQSRRAPLIARLASTEFLSASLPVACWRTLFHHRPGRLVAAQHRRWMHFAGPVRYPGHHQNQLSRDQGAADSSENQVNLPIGDPPCSRYGAKTVRGPTRSFGDFHSFMLLFEGRLPTSYWARFARIGSYLNQAQERLPEGCYHHPRPAMPTGRGGWNSTSTPWSDRSGPA